MRVLMATMQLDIGGAETHIVELSKALKRKGIEIFVASNGGAYVKEIEDAGIKHFAVPLNRKSPATLKKAYRELERIITEFKIDIVHAHARIPAFLCGMLHKKLGFRFVTTAHWVFDTRFPLNLLSDWGERSLAVSDDIKKYLIKSYGCRADNIRVTINGVDTDKFSDNIDYSDVAKEFSFGEGKTRIVYVSRMDIDRSLAAHKLIEAVPELFEKNPDLEVVIVGGGNDFEPIRLEAERMNETLGKNVIIVTGARTDINKFVAAADVFVGVSRAALEAMAAKKPSIIAGNEGYIGIFDEDKLKVSIDTNFCCRGEGETTTEKLKCDLLYLLDDANEEKRKELGEYAFETVRKYYSVDTMADDALKMYVSVATGALINEAEIKEIAELDKYLLSGGKRPIDIVVSGYYGFRNSGDDSILKAIIAELKNECPNISVTVLSKNPSETSRIFDVNSVDRLNFFKLWNLLGKAKLLISGGGSLIQDVTSSKSLYYYLAIMALAKLRGAKVMIYANGIGPVTKSKNLKHIKNVLKKIDYITLREQSSMDELTRIFEPTVPCKVTADPVFASKVTPADGAEGVLGASGIVEGEKFFLISVRDWKALDKNFEEKISEFSEFVYKNYQAKPLIVPMQRLFDKEISLRLLSKMKVPCAIIPEGLLPELMIAVTKKAEFVLGMRLHALIYAVKAGVPLIALDYDPKVAAIMKSIDLKYKESVAEIDEKRLKAFAAEIMENHDEIKAVIQKKSAEFEKLALENTKIAIELLKD